MSSMSELHAEMQGQDDMMECTHAHEEQAFYAAVAEVASFIENGSVTIEKVEKTLRGQHNG